MDIIFETPYLVRIVVTLAVILLLNRKFNNMIYATLGGILVLALWCGHGAGAIVSISWQRFSSLDNIFLAVVILQVIWLSGMMEKSGVMKDLVEVVRVSTSRKAGLAVLPAVIGWLPMPGGALFSAPMVDELDSENEIEPILKTKINYWFRHVWEYWWPLYPGVLLAIALTGLPFWEFILLQLPLSMFAIGGGVFFLLRKVPGDAGASQKDLPPGRGKKFLGLILPVIVVIISFLVISLFLPSMALISKYLPMIMGIFLAIVVLQIQRRLSPGDLAALLFSKSAFKLVLIVAVIRIYGAFIEAPLPGGTLLMGAVRDELAMAQIPVFIIIMILPFISGLATGLAIGFVGASFPIVVNLLGKNPQLGDLLSYTVVAFASGYIGMMLSPVHVCHMVTNEFFKTDLGTSMIRLVKPSAVVIAGSLLVALVVRTVFPTG